MKQITDFILESITDEQKKHLTRFKIDDLFQELKSNHVSKSRIPEIMKYYETILGPAPYYCISYNNKIGKSALKLANGRELLGLYDIDFWDKEIEANKDNEKVKNDLVRIRNKRIDHNKRVESFTPEQIEKIKQMQKNYDINIKAFKFGYFGRRTYLNAGIAELNDKYVPVIIQEWEPTSARDFDNLDDLVTYYFSASDID